MEHAERDHVWAVVLRFVRRRWRGPLQVFAASTAAVFVLAAALLQDEDAPEPAPAPVEAPGVVESLYRRQVGSIFDGTVAALAVRSGQAVKKGQPLFRMDTAWARAAAGEARAEQSAAAAALRELKARRDAEAAEIGREIRAVERQLAASAAAPAVPEESPELIAGWQPAAPAPEGPVPEVFATPDELLAQLQTLHNQARERASAWEPELRTARERLKAASAAVAHYTAMLEHAERRSPIDGVVTAVHAQPGSTVRAGQPVVQVDNPDGFRVVALLNKDATSRIKKGGRVPLEMGGSRMPGRVEKIVAGWDKDLFRYWVWLKPEGNGVRPGDTVEVVVPAGTHVASR